MVNGGRVVYISMEKVVLLHTLLVLRKLEPQRIVRRQTVGKKTDIKQH